MEWYSRGLMSHWDKKRTTYRIEIVCSFQRLIPGFVFLVSCRFVIYALLRALTWSFWFPVSEVLSVRQPIMNHVQRDFFNHHAITQLGVLTVHICRWLSEVFYILNSLCDLIVHHLCHPSTMVYSKMYAWLYILEVSFSLPCNCLWRFEAMCNNPIRRILECLKSWCLAYRSC